LRPDGPREIKRLQTAGRGEGAHKKGDGSVLQLIQRGKRSKNNFKVGKGRKEKKKKKEGVDGKGGKVERFPDEVRRKKKDLTRKKFRK